MRILPLCALFMFSHAIWDDRNLVEPLTWEKINKEIVDPDYLIMVIVYDRRGDNSIGLEPIYYDFVRDHRGLFRTLVYDCADDEDWSYTTKEGDVFTCERVAEKLKRCTIRFSADGVRADEACKKTCGTCP